MFRKSMDTVLFLVAGQLCLGAVGCSDDDVGGRDAAVSEAGRGDGAGRDVGPSADAGMGRDGGSILDGGGGDGAAPGEPECQDWEARHPEWLWCDDFEDGVPPADKYPDVGTTGMGVTEEDAFEGTHSLRQHYDAGQVEAGWVSFFYGDTLGRDYGPVRQEIYMRWYHKFEEGFEGFPPKMARIRSLGPGWEKRFAVHFWIEDGEIVADVHVPYSSQANDAGWLPIQHSGFYFTDPGNVGRWICFEMYVRANTPGQADGAYVFWADGQEIIRVENVDLVGDTDYHFNEAMLDCYWNGGSPKAQNRYYDNFVVSTQRIGCR